MFAPVQLRQEGSVAVEGDARVVVKAVVACPEIGGHLAICNRATPPFSLQWKWMGLR